VAPQLQVTDRLSAPKTTTWAPDHETHERTHPRALCGGCGLSRVSPWPSEPWMWAERSRQRRAAHTHRQRRAAHTHAAIMPVDGLPRLLRHLKLNGPTGLLLPYRRAIDRIPRSVQRPRPEVRQCDDIAARSLLSIARLNIAKWRVRPSICRRVRIDQLALVQGSRRGVEDIVCA